MQTLGNQQSPVKIITAEAFPIKFGSDYLQFHYSKPLPGKFGGDNFNVDPPGNKEDHTPWTITVGSTQWLIRKIHIHKKAEHLLDSDTPRPFECHMLHSAADDPAATGDKLVIGVFTVPRRSAAEEVDPAAERKALCREAGQGRDDVLRDGPCARPRRVPADQGEALEVVPLRGISHIMAIHRRRDLDRHEGRCTRGHRRFQ